MMNKYILIAGVLFLLISGFKYPAKEKVNWMTPEEIMAVYAKEPRPIIVDLYTDWCGWCKKMDKVTYEDPKVVDYINRNYYAMKYNAESRKAVQFNNKTFNFKPEYKSNEFAVYLTGGQLQYPTTVFLSSPGGQPAPLAGYLTPKQIEGPMKFFGGKHESKMHFQEFMKTFKPDWN